MENYCNVALKLLYFAPNYWMCRLRCTFSEGVDFKMRCVLLLVNLCIFNGGGLTLQLSYDKA